MKIKLIVPRWPKGSIWSSFVFRFPYLSVTTLAALTPKDIDVVIADENAGEIDFNEKIDIAAISIMTPLALRGYEIADKYRSMGVKVVMGGFHATWMPEEALMHADTIVIGEAEHVWPALLEDFKNNKLKKTYKPGCFAPLDKSPVPRRDLLNKDKYFFINTMQATRGCPFNCDFCSVTSFYGRTYRYKPVEDIERELQSMAGGSNFLFLVDDNVIGNPAHASKLFKLLKKYPHKWLSQASTTFTDYPELLKLAQESGCYGMFIGFETLSQEGLDKLNKRFNRSDTYADLIKKMHDHGMGVQGSFIFGYDWDTKDSFDMVSDFVEKVKMDSVLYTILTPYPGTKVFERMKAEGRLITTDWSKYDMAHVVYKPKNMTVEELQEGYLNANRRFYSWKSMFKRLPAFRRSLMVFGPMNWGFKRAWEAFKY
jgi:radical SAM superfamily enzyme YgiQ (UPF0313 family)